MRSRVRSVIVPGLILIAGALATSLAPGRDGPMPPGLFASGRLAVAARRPEGPTGGPAGLRVRTLEGHHDQIHAVAFDADGTRVASSGHDCTIRVWDTDTGRELRVLIELGRDPLRPFLPRRRPPALGLAFVPGGHQVVSGGPEAFVFNGRGSVWSGGAIRIWDVATGTKTREFSGHETYILGVAVSEDGRRIAAIDIDCTLKIREFVADRKSLPPVWGDDPIREPTVLNCRFYRCPNGNTVTTSIAFSADARRAVAIAQTTGPQGEARDGLVLFDGAKGLVRSVPRSFFCTTLSPNGLYVAAVEAVRDRAIGDGWEHEIAILDFETGAALHKAAIWIDKWVSSLGFSPDGEYLACGHDDGSLEVFVRRSGLRVGHFQGPSGAVRAVAFVRGGLRVVSGGRKDLGTRDENGSLQYEPLMLWDARLNLNP